MSKIFLERFSTRSRAAATPLMGWLAQNPQLVQTAERYLELEKHIAQYLGAAMSPCKIAQWKGDQLTLAVPSAAHATKLRQQVPTLINYLKRHQWQLSTIKIQIQSVLFTGVEPLGYVHQGGAGIDATGLDAFEQLENQLEDGPLALAVRRLLARHQD